MQLPFVAPMRHRLDILRSKGYDRCRRLEISRSILSHSMQEIGMLASALFPLKCLTVNCRHEEQRRSFRLIVTNEISITAAIMAILTGELLLPIHMASWAQYCCLSRPLSTQLHGYRHDLSVLTRHHCQGLSRERDCATDHRSPTSLRTAPAILAEDLDCISCSATHVRTKPSTKSATERRKECVSGRAESPDRGYHTTEMKINCSD